MTYRKDIDGLRALAVVLVIIYHAFPKLLPNGFLGVDIFFVISGYLINKLILEKLEGNSFSYINFYIRRIKRILPVALVVLGTLALAGSLMMNDIEITLLKTHLFWASFFSINYGLMSESGYFDLSTVYKPLMHFWSLAVEEQFYLVWPLLIGLIYKFAKKFTWKRTIIFLLLSIIFADSLYYFLTSSKFIYYSTYARGWELIAGALIALVNQKQKQWLTQKKIRLDVVSAVLLAAALFAVDGIELSSVFAVGSAVAFILAEENSNFKSYFDAKHVVFIGLMSYSLYLWHWPLISFMYIFFGDDPGAVKMALALSLTAVFSWLSYRYIERPLRNQNWDIEFGSGFKPANFKHTAYVSAILAGFVILFVTSPKLPQLAKRRIQVEPSSNEPGKPGCLLSRETQGNLKWCETKQGTGNLQGIVIGDSHAHSLYPGLLAEAGELTWQLIAWPSCPPFPIYTPDATCRITMTETLQKLKQKSNIRKVVLIMANRIFTQYKTQLTDPKVVANAIAELKQMQYSGKELIIIKPVPEIASNIGICLEERPVWIQKFLNKDEGCSILRKDWEAEAAGYLAFIDSLKAAIPEIRLVDPADEICNKQTCYAVKNEKSMYIDKDHLSFYGSSAVAKAIFAGDRQ